MLRDRREPLELDRRELPEDRRLLRPIEDIRREPLLRDEDEDEDEDKPERHLRRER